MKKNPILVFVFEIVSILACIIFPFMIFLNAGGWFFPIVSAANADVDLLDCMKTTVIAAGVFFIFIGIALVALIVDCFVVMKDVKGFKVSLVSICTAPASYPIVRTEALEEDRKFRMLHVIAGGAVFVSNGLVVVSFVYYIIRIMITAGSML